ncbi:hypothetical protein [Nonomuraea roseoviolacea]|uniref:Phage holin family protein n=1 Tax=Nonomuraea roseoviolacea subsp. carminata TaxID=160689 RepID=A0ABT1JQI7_9ACTN|nr:hypothetical protein [Nonomuraea roseoviolacea]MCP2343985.1 hypothetical protein [Nonomuraea roseoviolacea subsp. carminata]
MKKPVVTDLTKIEGDPTPQADLLEDRERVTFEVTLSGGKRMNASAPAWSPSGIAPAIVMITLPSIMIPSAFAGLGIAVSAPGWAIVTAALIAFCVTAGCGVWIISRFAGLPAKGSRES